MSSARQVSPTAAAQPNLPPPEVILPSQFFDATRADLSPMQRLLLAVLEDGVECAMNLGGSRRAMRLRREAQHWIFAAAAVAPLTFEAVCGALNIDPDYLRAGLNRWLRAARAGCTPARVPYRQNTRRHDVVTATKRRPHVGSVVPRTTASPARGVTSID
jgi:hypothetical protein